MPIIPEYSNSLTSNEGVLLYILLYITEFVSPTGL